MFQVGEERILTKATFLYKGVFVFQNSQVRIKDVIKSEKGNIYSVEYYDREGNILIIEGIEEKDIK